LENTLEIAENIHNIIYFHESGEIASLYHSLFKLKQD
jgi:hypothetical protein